MEDNTRGRGDGLHNRGLFKWGVFYCPRLPCGGVLLRGVFRKGKCVYPYTPRIVPPPTVIDCIHPIGEAFLR